MYYLKELEAESIYIIRESLATFQNPVVLYSIGKDSSVLLHLIQKALYPQKISIPLLHVDTGYKFKEMLSFRDYFTQKIGAQLLIYRNEEKIRENIHPLKVGVDACCLQLKTNALLGALKQFGFDAALGGARREEEKSRAKERIFSIRNNEGKWDPHNQRPELWHVYNHFLGKDKSMRVFPLSNWTELDIWTYIKQEQIEVVPLYFSKIRDVVMRNGIITPVENIHQLQPHETIEKRMVRFRSLGCSPCTGAILSKAQTIDEIIDELRNVRKSERENRIIDLTSDTSMEMKKREGYF